MSEQCLASLPLLPQTDLTTKNRPRSRYKLGNDPVLWKCLEFSFRSDMSFDNMVRTVSQRSCHLRSITLKNFRSAHVMERMLWHIGNNCSRLKQARRECKHPCT